MFNLSGRCFEGRIVEADGSRVTWTYDAASQLTGEHRTGTNAYQHEFRYDSRSNRTLKIEDGQRTTYAYDVANQMTYAQDASGRTTYLYDADGNQEVKLAPGGDRTTYVWDYENRMSEAILPTGVRNTMSYEPDGLRVKLEESTGTKKFIWDDQNYLATANASDVIQTVYTNEPQTYGNLISHRESGASSFYHFDALGSTRTLTNASETVLEQYNYGAWGEILGSPSILTPFLWVGQVGYHWDSEVENQYVRARYYRPTIARWLSVDPLEFVDGVNRYKAYFIPNMIDPSGLKCICCCYYRNPIGGELGDPPDNTDHGAGASYSWQEVPVVLPEGVPECSNLGVLVDSHYCGKLGPGNYKCCGAPGRPDFITIPLKFWHWNYGGWTEQAQSAYDKANEIWEQCCIKFTWDGAVVDLKKNAGGASRNMPTSDTAPSFPPAHDILLKHNTGNTIDVHLVPGFKAWPSGSHTLIPKGVTHHFGQDPIAMRPDKDELLAHEIGHALGLRHVTGDKDRLMHPTSSTDYWVFPYADERNRSHPGEE